MVRQQDQSVSSNSGGNMIVVWQERMYQYQTFIDVYATTSQLFKLRQQMLLVTLLWMNETSLLQWIVSKISH